MENIYQMKVTLKGLRPPIWRRFQVPGHYTFYDLHRVIQHLMEWTNGHLHEFEMGEIRIGTPERSHPFFTARQVKNEKHLTLEKMISAEKTKFIYTYDFGDDWVHELLVEKIIPSPQRMEHPVCLSGRRAGPPEDIGGVWGYAEGLQVLQTPPPEDPADEDEETRDMREWLGEGFDPGYFNLEEINERLEYLKPGETDPTESLVEDQEIRLLPVIKGKKVGRNEPCPCGSGKKYKKCCGR